jgi:protein SCO1/2
MTARTTRIILIFSAFVVGLAVAFGAVMLIAGRGAGPMVTQASAVGGPFRLVEGNGNVVTDQDMKGKPFLVFFGYTHCPDICPTALFELSEIMHAMGKDADRLSALFITVDPERDTPAVIKDYLSSFDPHLRGATGDAPAIEQVEKAYRVYAKKVPTKNGDYSMDHSAVVYLMDKEGRFVAPFNLKRQPAEAADALRKYL